MISIVHGEPAAILRRDINSVLLKRQAKPPPGLDLALRVLPEWSRTVTASRAGLAAAAAALLEPLPALGLRAQLHSSIVGIAHEFCEVMGYEEVDATLECVKGVTCPRFHADVVEVRCLCTFCGPGTMWVEDRFVDRRRLSSLPKDDVVGWSSIAHPSVVRQAAPGEVLYLKGSRFPGSEGRGAVHRSPDGASALVPRLLLKLDGPRSAEQACAAGCLHRH